MDAPVDGPRAVRGMLVALVAALALAALPAYAQLQIAIVQGDGQSAVPGTVFAQALRVKVTDAIGVPVSGQTVAFAAVPNPTTGASATLVGGSATNGNGESEVTATANAFLGAFQVTAMLGGGAGQVTFALTNGVLKAAFGNGVDILVPPVSPTVTLTQWYSIDAPQPRPSGNFLYGLMGFTIEGLAPGAFVAVDLELPSAATLEGQYYAYQNGSYSNMSVIFATGLISLPLTDGGLGDADGAANGVIVHLGGPATASLGVVPHAVVEPVPALGAPLLALLALLVAGIGMVGRRKR
jgi:hypothetical protein